MNWVRQALDSAWQHYRRGEWQQAEQLYRQVLSVDPNQLDALQLLAAIAGQTDRDNLAIKCLQAALRLQPGSAVAHNNLGNVFAQQKKLPEAVANFREAVRLQPGFAVAHNNLGNALRELGHPSEAVASLEEALRIDAGYAEAHQNLGLAWLALGRLSEAVASFQRVLSLRPNDPEAQFQLGNVLLQQEQAAAAAICFQHALRLKADHVDALYCLALALKQQGKPEGAAQALQQVIRLKPDFAEAHVELGNLLAAQRKLPEAVASFEYAVRLRPDFAVAHNNLGNALRESARLPEAEASLRQALRIEPDYADAHYNLGIVLWRQKRLEEAVASYEQALRYKPDYSEAYLNIGNARKDQGRLDDAIEAFRTALGMTPDSSQIHGALVLMGNARKNQARLDDATADSRSAPELKPDAANIHSALVFSLYYHPRSDPRTIYEESARWNQHHAEPLRPLIRPHHNHPDPERRIRIGYVSPDFREHVDCYFTIPLLSNHNHGEFEVACYASVSRPDASTERLRGYADLWRSTVDLSDQQLADLVRGDQIDILVDLKLHTANNRLLMFARKPAPVQVTWLGYPGTTGLSTIDYRLTDPYLDPPGLFDEFYSEESVRLPDTFWCYDLLADEPPVNALPALESGVVTFGCLNNFCKVNDGCLALWARVLERVPQSRLLMMAPAGEARAHVIAVLEERGIAPSRVEFVSRQPRSDYLRLYHRIDVALDPLPYNGHTTSLDGFWMGVPTVTLLGKTVVGRAGWSQLCNLGLRELASETADGFVELAVGLAGDLPRLSELRSGLRVRMEQSPLMDGARFARHVEQAYRTMWRRWCEGQQPHEQAGVDPSEDRRESSD